MYEEAARFATLSIPLLIVKFTLMIVQGALRDRGIVARPALLMSLCYCGIALPATTAVLCWFDAPPMTIWIGLGGEFPAATLLLVMFFVRTNLVGDLLEHDE